MDGRAAIMDFSILYAKINCKEQPWQSKELNCIMDISSIFLFVHFKKIDQNKN